MPVTINEYKLYKIESIFALFSTLSTMMGFANCDSYQPFSHRLSSKILYQGKLSNFICFKRSFSRDLFFNSINFTSVTFHLLDQRKFNKLYLLLFLIYKIIKLKTIKVELILPKSVNNSNYGKSYLVYGLDEPTYILPIFSELEIIPQR